MNKEKNNINKVINLHYHFLLKFNNETITFLYKKFDLLYFEKQLLLNNKPFKFNNKKIKDWEELLKNIDSKIIIVEEQINEQLITNEKILKELLNNVN